MNWISHVYNTTLILTHTQKNKELSSNTSTSGKKRRQIETSRNSQANKKNKKQKKEEPMTSLLEGTKVAQYWYLQSLPNRKNFGRWVWFPGTVTKTSNIEATIDEEGRDQEGFNTRIEWDTIELDGRVVYEGGETCDETLFMKDHLKEFTEVDLFQNEDNWVHGSFANKVLKWQNDGGLKGLNDTKCELVEVGILLLCILSSPYFYF